MARKQVTMGDVAKEMGISIVTVSKALAGKEGVSEGLRELIILKAQELGYEYNGGRKAADTVSATIGIVISERFVGDNENSFYFKIYQKLLMGLSAKGYIGILEIIRHEDEQNGVLPNMLRMDSVSQVVIIGEMEPVFLEKLVSSPVSVIFFDFENEEFDVDSITGDNVNGGFLLTRYLAKKGHEHIGFVGSYHSTRSILDRFMGYRKYLIAKDKEYKSEWTILDRDKNGRYVELELPENMPTAFVCNCDEVAYAMIDKLSKAGYRVPEDISVVGYDDYAQRIPQDVFLTTYRVNAAEMVRCCLHIIEQRVKNKYYRRGMTTIRGELVERDTVRDMHV